MDVKAVKGKPPVVGLYNKTPGIQIVGILLQDDAIQMLLYMSFTFNTVISACSCVLWILLYIWSLHGHIIMSQGGDPIVVMRAARPIYVLEQAESHYQTFAAIPHPR